MHKMYLVCFVVVLFDDNLSFYGKICVITLVTAGPKTDVSR